jgi:prophage regulatory protein
MANSILRLPEVKTRVGLSRSSIYLRVADGSFPRPIALGARAVGWVESEVEEWISSKITESRASSPANANREAH